LEVWAAVVVVVVVAVVVLALEIAWVAPGVAVEVLTGILEEVASTVVDGAVTHGTTMVSLAVAGARVVVVVARAMAVAIGAVTILMVAISRILVEGLSEAVLVVVVGEDQALIQVVVADMAQVVAWEAMAEARVGSELS
jgi:hypothetical protein